MLLRCGYLLLGIVLTLAVSETVRPFLYQDSAALRLEQDAVTAQFVELASAVQFLKRQVRYMDPVAMEAFPEAAPVGFANVDAKVLDGAADQEAAVFYEASNAATMSNLAQEVWTLSDEVDAYFYKAKARKKLFLERPFLRPAQGWLSSHFGWRVSPTSGRKAYHKGIDLAAMPGSKVVAPTSGQVKFAGNKTGYGKVVILDHGEDVNTILAHLGKISVKRGDVVERGQVVGKVGTTGSSTGFHLHYEVLVDGKQVNPWAFLEFKPEREGPLVCDPDEI